MHCGKHARASSAYKLGLHSAKQYVKKPTFWGHWSGFAFFTMARRSGRYRAVALVLVIVPVFTLVAIFGVEWSYVERISREDAEAGERSPVENNRKRAIMNNRWPLVHDNQGRKAADPHLGVPEPSRNENINEELEGVVSSKLQKQARGNMSTGVIDSLSQQSLNMLLSDREKLYELLKERKLHELRMEKSIREVWWYVRDRVAMLDGGKNVAKETIKGVREQYDLMRWHFNNLRNVGNSDGPTQLNWAYWQKRISQEMTKLMERRLKYLQNPRDCASAKKLICKVSKTCGFGCQIHHVAYCFILAYATKRTLVLDATNWRYSSSGWDAVFQPISETCTTASGEIASNYSK